MKKNNVIWVPRVAAILLNVFVGAYFLDMLGFLDMLDEMVIDIMYLLSPSCFLIFLTLIAWKKEKTGGILFIIVSLFSLLFLHSAVTTISTLIVGILFLAAAKMKK